MRKTYPELQWLFAYILALLALASMGGCWAQKNMEPAGAGQKEKVRVTTETPVCAPVVDTHPDKQSTDQAPPQPQDAAPLPTDQIQEEPNPPITAQPDDQPSNPTADKPPARAAAQPVESQDEQAKNNKETRADSQAAGQEDLADVAEQKEKELPLVAIIIDDMGFHQQVGEKMLDLPLNLTFSFLPHAPFTRQHEQKAYELGRDVLLHLPMEPQDSSWDPGPSALYLSTPPEQVSTIIDQYLELVPHAIGANNHMGSLFTENRQAMHIVLEKLQEHNLFFVDSFTTSGSVAMQEAQKMGVPTVRRNIFLDNIHKQKNVCHQLELLIRQAERHGHAIGIGHPNEVTLLALTKCRANLLKRVKLVSIHELMNDIQKKSERTAHHPKTITDGASREPQ